MFCHFSKCCSFFTITPLSTIQPAIMYKILFVDTTASEWMMMRIAHSQHQQECNIQPKEEKKKHDDDLGKIFRVCALTV